MEGESATKSHVLGEGNDEAFFISGMGRFRAEGGN